MNGARELLVKLAHTFDSSFLDALDGQAGYVVTFNLAPDAQAKNDKASELKLVHQDTSGFAGCYKTR